MSEADLFARPESFSREFSLDVPNDRGGKVLAQKAIEKFGSEHGWPYEILNEIDLILEEWLTNVIAYGGVEESKGVVSIMLRLQGDFLAVTISDSGKEFNPLVRPLPDITTPLEGKPIGGLGLLMIEKLVDGIEWERRDSRNILRFRKSIKTPKLAL